MFLAVDLEVRSREPLEPLLTALEKRRIIVQRHARVRGRSRATFSQNGAYPTHDAALRRWVRVIGALRGRARELVRTSIVVASIGFEATDAHSSEVVIAPAEVRALARLGVGIEVVVHAPGRPANPE